MLLHVTSKPYMLFKINYLNQVKMTQNKYILLLKEDHTKINCLRSCFTRQNITNIEFQAPMGQ